MAMAFAALAVVAHGQGQNMFQSDGFGNQYLLSPAPPLFPFPARSVHVGTSANGLATLRVRGDQLPVNSFWPAFGGGASVCTFRTDVGDDTNQNWDMVSGTKESVRLWYMCRRTLDNYF